MDAVGLLNEAAAAGLRLRLDGDLLKVSGSKAAAGIVERIRAAKAEVVAALRSGSSFDQLHAGADEQGRYALDERAAIYEYDGCLSRIEAERQAAAEWEVSSEWTK